MAAFGFPVPRSVASVAFDPGPVQDAAKTGALWSFGAPTLALLAGELARVEKRTI